SLIDAPAVIDRMRSLRALVNPNHDNAISGQMLIVQDRADLRTHGRIDVVTANRSYLLFNPLLCKHASCGWPNWFIRSLVCFHSQNNQAPQRVSESRNKLCKLIGYFDLVVKPNTLPLP